MTAPQKQTPAVGAGAAVDQGNKPADCAEIHPVAQVLSHYARKRQARLQAVAALQGVALHRLANGGWLASRWNLSRELTDAEIEAWLARVGGAA